MQTMLMQHDVIHILESDDDVGTQLVLQARLEPARTAKQPAAPHRRPAPVAVLHRALCHTLNSASPPPPALPSAIQQTTVAAFHYGLGWE